MSDGCTGLLFCCQSGLLYQLYHGSSAGEFFSCRFELSLIFYVGVMLFAFYFQVQMWLHFTPMGAQPFGFAQLQTSGHTYGSYMCLLVFIPSPSKKCTK